MTREELVPSFAGTTGRKQKNTPATPMRKGYNMLPVSRIFEGRDEYR